MTRKKMWLFLLSYISVCVLISAEVITLIENDKITCVLTEDSVNSTIYVSNLDSSITLNRTSEDISNINNNDWTRSNSIDKFRSVLDQRWTSFRKSHNTRLSGKKTFSVYLQPKTRITVNDITQHCLTTIPIGNSSDNSSFGQWHHYEIKRSNNSIKLNEPEVHTIYDETLKDQPEWIAFPQNANYRLQEYNFLYSNTTSKSESYIKISTLNCTALYVSVDEGCYLNISVQPTNKIITVDGFNKKYDLKEWKKYEIRTEPDGNEQTLSFYRGRKDNSIKGYWAIDDIHSCSSQTVIYKTRVDQLWNNHTCMELNRTDSSNTFCDNASFGKQCHIKCDEILGSSYPNCEEHRICLSENNCHCAWGYYGENCKEVCEENFWGLDCKEQCTNCDKCDRKIGCQKCKAKFFGKNCEYQLPVVTKPPTLESITYNTIQILINFDYAKNHYTGTPEFYIIQTKKLDSSERFENSTTLEDYPSGTENAIKSLHLIRDYSYQIRTILISDNLSFQDDTVPVLVIHKRSLRDHFKEDDIITLTWAIPNNTKFDIYYIEYKCLKTFCSNESETNNKTTKQNHIELENTKHFMMCNFRLFITKGGNKELIDETTITTQKSNKSIEERELPKNIIFLKNQIVLELEECNSFSGPLNYSIKFNCTSKWCTNDPPKDIPFDLRSYKATQSIDVGYLIPFTDYSITVIAKRNGQKNRSQNYSRKSTPSKPHSVKDVFVDYIHNDNLFLRWKEDYPPTGQTETYNVTIESNTSIAAFNFANVSCKIWNDFLCASISRYTNFNVFTITIQAKNYDVSDWSPATSLVVTVENVTSAPQNLGIAFNPECSNEVILTWKHPIYTYGIINNFQILVDDGKTNKHITAKVSNTINFKQTIKIEHGKAYTFTVWAENSHHSKNASVFIFVSKSIPKFSNKPCIIWCEAKCYIIVPKLETQEVKVYSIIVIKQNKKIIRKIQRRGLNLPPEDTILCTESNTSCDIHLQLQDVANQTYYLKTSHEKIRIEFPINDNANDNVIRATIILISVVTVLSVTLLTAILTGFIYYRYKHKKSTPEESDNIHTTETRENETLISKTDQSNFTFQPIEINDFPNYLFTSLRGDPDTNFILQQFQAVPTKEGDCTQGRLTKNAKKNHYRNILPYDDTRVILQNNDNGDYINANYVDGYEHPKAFIATQAPLISTVHDFWTMVCQENVKTIVMLNKPKGECNQCEKYWPDTHFRFGQFLIECVSVEKNSDYIHRILEVKWDNQSRTIHHYQYLTWSTKNTPSCFKNFTTFVKEVTKLRKEYPVVVHSEGGCRRTGIYILCDIVIRMSLKEKKVDFFNTLKEMRNQRSGLVSQLEQYIFCHFVVFEYYFGESFSSRYTTDHFVQKLQEAIEEPSLARIMQKLEKATEEYHKTNNDKNTAGQDNINKNIGPITVDCWNYARRFIVTKEPSQNTLQGFWNLVLNREVEIILSLNRLNDNDQQDCPIFWPNDTLQDWSFNKTTKLIFLNEEDSNDVYSTITVKIDTTYKSDDRIVKIICVKTWERTSVTPSNVKDMIYVCDKIVPYNGQIVITCCDGKTASGLFVAMAFLLEKISKHRSCDVFGAAKTVKKSCPQFLKNPEQIKCLYLTALEYIREYNIYEFVA